MSVSTTVSKAGPFIADGTQRVFPFEFPILSTSHVAVYAGTSLVVGGYTVSSTASGGSVTFDTAPEAGEKIVILRNIPFLQTLDLQDNTAFFAESLERGYDYLCMMCQQLKEEMSRAWRDSPTGDGLKFSEVIPALEQVGPQVQRAIDAANTAVAKAAECAAAKTAAETAATNASGFSASASQAATDAAASAASAGSSASSAATSAGNAASSAASAAESAEEAAEAAGGKWFNSRSNIAIHAQNYSYTAGGEAYVECEASGVLMHQESATPTYSARLLYHFYNASGEEYMTMEGNTVLTGVIGADNHVTWGLSTDSYLPAISGDGEARTLGAITELRIPLRMNHVDITTDRTLASVTFNPQN